MTRCQTTCTGVDQRAYRVAMTHRELVACAEHAAYLTGQGVTLIPIERRRADVAVVQDRRRRRFVPAWLRNLKGRDETGRLVA